MGLLDMFNGPEGQQTMALLAAAAPTTDPNANGFGVRLAGAQAYMQKQKDDELKRQAALQAQQLQAMTMQEMQQKIAQERQIRELAGRFQTPAVAGTSPLMGDPESGILPSAGTARPAGFDYRGYAGALAAIDPIKALALQQSLKKEQPKFGTEPRYDQNGRAFILAEDGSMKYLDGVKARDKLEEVRLGNSVGFRSPYSTELQGSLPIGQSPDSVASNALTLRGQNMVDARKAQELQGAEEAFTPQAIANAAARYNTDGTLPPMGMGKAGTMGRAAILNQAAILAQQSGLSGDDQRVAQLGNKANAAALSKLQTQQTMVGAFEKNANKNADMALSLSGQVDRTGVPIFNAWMQAGQKSVTGNAKLAEFHASNETFVNEYAKIMSGSMGNTAVSDSARNQAHSLLNTAQTPEAYAAVVNRLKLEMQNRMAGFEEEKQALRGSMSTGYKPPAPAVAPAAVKTPVASGMLNGRKVIKYSDGSTAYAN
jgi:hypothetical protein